MMRAIVLAVLVAAGPAYAAAPSPEAVSRKDQGDARRDAGDATGALAAYREALKSSPDYIEAWEEIGKLYFGAKKFGEAADAFQRAVEIDGSFANNWFNLALARRRAGELERSRDAFRRYLVLKPDDFDGRMKLGDVLRALEDRDGAMREYQAVVDAADSRTIAPSAGERAKEAIAQLRAAPAKPAVKIVPVAPAPAAAPPAPPAAAVVLPSTPMPPAPVAAPAAPPVQPAIQAVAPPTPSAPAPQPAAPPVLPEPIQPPSPALLDKLALGDRLQGAGDYRGALFAYQDAVYLEPRNVAARVKLGRAYWTLHYAGQAEEQWQQATQLAPNDPGVARQIEEARKAPRPALGAEAAPNGSGAAAHPGGTQANGGATVRPPEGPRVYKFVPEGQGGAASQPSAPPIAPAPREPAAAPSPGYAPAQPPAFAQPAPPSYPQQPAPDPSASPPAYPQQYQQQYAQPQPQYPQPAYPPAQPQYPSQQQYAQPQYGQPQYPQPQYPQPQYAQPQAQVPQAAYPPAQPGYGPQAVQPAPPTASAAAASQHYRAALSLYVQRDYLGAIAELDAAITLDPNLSVAYTARGSAKFGLRKFREAAADYKGALDLDPTKAEPIWGLAECQRMLGDPAAVDTYRRYAASIAGDVNEDRRSKARRWAAELSNPPPR